MRKFTLLLMSMFFVLGTAMAKDEESAEFALQYSTPKDGEKVTSVYNVILGFTKDVVVAFPEGGIDVVNNETKDVVKITRVYSDEWSPKNQVTFLFEQETVAGKEGKDESRDKIIETPGTYSYTIPAGVIKSVDGEEFPETTFTFSIVSTFSHVSYTPTEATSLEKIELTFDKEITEVKMPNGGLVVTDFYWTNFFNVKNEVVISDDKKTVTLALETPITTPGQYFMELYQGVFISADGISQGANLSFNVIDPAPSFTTTYNDGDKVKELGNVFEIAFKNVKEVKLLQETMTVYLPSQGDVEGKATLADNKITVTFEQKFTAEGEYSFYIPAGMFTMDGVANEELEVKVTLFTFKIEPLEVVSVTPAVGKVDQLTKIVVKFNQLVSLYYDADGKTLSNEIKLTCGDKEYTLNYAPSGYNITDQVEYMVNAQWMGTEWGSTSPVTEDGTYTLNLADIIVNHAGEEVIDAWGYPVTKWHSEGKACEGVVTWTIGEGDSAVDFVSAEAGEQVIYDLLGRRVEKIVEAGLYIVNGKKVVIK